MSKEITIAVPDGKRAEWINGVLTLVDEPKVDNRPVTERIKTFEDAREALGDEHPLVKEYWGVVNVELDITQDLIAYLKLRIIVAALNEGWEPKLDVYECRYCPFFNIYTEKEYEEFDEDEKKKYRFVELSDNGADASGGVVYVQVYSLSTSHGSKISLKTRELAEYCGVQFAEVWADYMFNPRTGK